MPFMNERLPYFPCPSQHHILTCYKRHHADCCHERVCKFRLYSKLDHQTVKDVGQLRREYDECTEKRQRQAANHDVDSSYQTLLCNMDEPEPEQCRRSRTVKHHVHC